MSKHKHKRKHERTEDPEGGPAAVPGAAAFLGADWGEKLDKRVYDKRKRALQIELLKVQSWVKSTGQRVVVVFEGRDAAGKGGTIKRFREYLNPRGARMVALGTPSEAEKGQWYFQRYVAHLPSAGEIVLFDRSWYNRAGVERVMGFCDEDQYHRFLHQAPLFERMLAEDGIWLFKLWLSITKDEQRRRLQARRSDPLKHWKLSPLDLMAQDRWSAYSAARDRMFEATDTDVVPWTVIQCNDKRHARLSAMQVVLSALPYPGKDREVVTGPDPRVTGRAADVIDRFEADR